MIQLLARLLGLYIIEQPTAPIRYGSAGLELVAPNN